MNNNLRYNTVVIKCAAGFYCNLPNPKKVSLVIQARNLYPLPDSFHACFLCEVSSRIFHGAWYWNSSTTTTAMWGTSSSAFPIILRSVAEEQFIHFPCTEKFHGHEWISTKSPLLHALWWILCLMIPETHDHTFMRDDIPHHHCSLKFLNNSCMVEKVGHVTSRLLSCLGHQAFGSPP